METFLVALAVMSALSIIWGVWEHHRQSKEVFAPPPEPSLGRDTLEALERLANDG